MCSGCLAVANSTLVDIINVVSVVGRATVNHVCGNAAEGGLHWQWAFDYRTSKISVSYTFSTELICDAR